ncbi:predicted protein [Naegleria gruberi]|uniref:Predicted protein n=1 Tax=Naegleria gruberi TaxID=5762 RepID=D2VX13_NAEGR|nr:uncharacterized protein NAEGRDRAFT_73579 [Naegleria gruberi]EFC38604.1 predicted protein [Naegleria gruberi]|eukprot:XP_002671348.1 predicted protein [Naegleria gruberi strain NEG-M]
MNEILSERVFMSILNLTRFKQLTNLIMKNPSNNIINRLVDECGLRSIYLDFFGEKDISFEWSNWEKYFSIESLNNLHVLHISGSVGNPIGALHHLTNCRILSLSQNNVFYKDSLQTIMSMKKLTHLCLTNFNSSEIPKETLYIIFSCLGELYDLQVLELISEVALELKIDSKVEKSVSSTKIQQLTLIAPSINIIEDTLTHSKLFFNHLQVCQYIFLPIGKASSRFFVPSVDRLNLALLSSSFPLSLFSKISIDTLYIWKDTSFEMIDLCYSKLFIGSRFKDDKKVGIDKVFTNTCFKITNSNFSYSHGKQFENLQSLIIDGSSHLYIDDLLNALSSARETLSTLIMSRCEFYNSIVTSTKSLTFTKLKEFRLCSVYPVYFLMENLRFKAPLLEILEITDLYQTEPETLIKFISESSIPLHSLKEFKLKEAQLGDHYLCELFQKVLPSPNLTQVEVCSVGPITMDGLQLLSQIPDYNLSKITSFSLPRFEVKPSKLDEYFLFIRKLNNLKVLTINIESIDILVDVLERICHDVNNLEKLNIVLSDRLNIKSTYQKNDKISYAIKKLILSMSSLKRIILDWSPFDNAQLEDFRKSIRSSGKQPPKLVFPLSSLNNYKTNSNSSCDIQ